MNRVRVLRNLVQGRPILVIFDVTRRCNQRCAFCAIPQSSRPELDLPAIRACAARLARFGIGYVFLQGGEPLLRSDLMDIVDAFIECGIKPTVITNGMLLDRSFAEKIARRACNLAVSLDSMKPDVVRALRGVDCLERVVANLRDAASVRDRRGNWAITTTITSLTTDDDLDELREFANELGMMYAIRPYVHVSGTAGRHSDELVLEGDARNRALSQFEKFAERAKSDNYLASLVYEQHVRYLRNEDLGPCDAARYSVFLQADGALATCIEHPELELDLDAFKRTRDCNSQSIRDCWSTTPCFYNDAREVGVLWRSKWRILAHAPDVIRQLVRYGDFF